MLSGSSGKLVTPPVSPIRTRNTIRQPNTVLPGNTVAGTGSPPATMHAIPRLSDKRKARIPAGRAASYKADTADTPIATTGRARISQGHGKPATLASAKT